MCAVTWWRRRPSNRGSERYAGGMKRLHRPDLLGWSVFNAERNLDFHSVLWLRPEGNVVFDPLPISEHDFAHLASLGTLAWIVITNSDHVRDAARLAELTGAKLAGPAGEQSAFPIACDRWLVDGDVLVDGLQVFALEGSKTLGELALLVGSNTLITGDLVRAHEGGRLTLLPDAKLKDKALALRSVARLAARDVDAVLVGDGWPVFRDGQRALTDLLSASA
jgi:glyoxylase-like metal-dependent hydrolase (beta-lactamase superfamily II)